MTNYTNKMQQQVQEFHEVFEHPTTDKPTPMSLARANGRSQWGTGEELVEFIHASSTNDVEFKQAFSELLLGLRKAYEKQSTKAFPTNDEERIIAQADAIADRLYFTYGDAVEIGVDMEPIMSLVHDANMSKLFTNEETGEKYVKYNDEGKVMKSPEFEAPEDKIKAEILTQLKPKSKAQVKKKATNKRKAKEEAVVIDSNYESNVATGIIATEKVSVGTIVADNVSNISKDVSEDLPPLEDIINAIED